MMVSIFYHERGGGLTTRTPPPPPPIPLVSPLWDNAVHTAYGRRKEFLKAGWYFSKSLFLH